MLRLIFKSLIILFLGFYFVSCSGPDKAMITEVKNYAANYKESKIDVSVIVKKHLNQFLNQKDLMGKLKDFGFDVYRDKSDPSKNIFIAVYEYRGLFDFFSFNEIRIIFEVNAVGIVDEIVAFHMAHNL